jgi:hypothetical protein
MIHFETSNSTRNYNLIPHLGTYEIIGLNGQWLFWSISADDETACFVASGYPVLPNPMFDKEEEWAEQIIRRVNPEDSKFDYITVPFSLVKAQTKEAETEIEPLF